MNTMTQAPAVANYASQAANHSPAFYDAVERATLVAYVDLAVTAWPIDLMDYLAERAIANGAEARHFMATYLEDALPSDPTSDRLERALEGMKAAETEAARALVHALGERPGAIAPVDYPTIVRAYVAARNAAGHTFSVRR